MVTTTRSSRTHGSSGRPWRHVGVMAFLLVGCTLGCDSPSLTLGDELPVDPAQPYNAVGMMNNGCTAFLIDADHIVAAAHCFVNTNTGQWQQRPPLPAGVLPNQLGLRFYPNFHPDRVDADDTRVPRADITRAVVGSRAGETTLGGSPMDWGIAKVENWRDIGGLDLTPLALAPASPTVGAQLVNPAYNRHHCPYNDMDSVTWDNMQQDVSCGQWVRVRQDPPLADGTNEDHVDCNTRWIAGSIHRDCTITNVVDDVVQEDCVTNGGSSGSPIIQTGSGPWTAVGVVHGGGGPDFGSGTPDCSIPSTGEGASVDRFREAPRFAENVAVHRRPDNPAATALFAVDGDRDVVVFRAREGASPGWADRFSWWTSLGAPPQGGELTRIAACSTDEDSHPQIFVIGDQVTLHTRGVGPDDNWGAWAFLDLPAGTGRVVDLDATTDDAGRCQIVIATTGAGLQTRNKMANGGWSAWTQVASGSYTEVTALRYDGIISVAMIDPTGAAWRTWYDDDIWFTPVPLGAPSGVTAWRDVDMTWDEAGRGFMLATPEGGGNVLWFTPMYGGADTAWTWRFFDTGLWAPGFSPQNAPELLTITASRWMEDPPGMTSPVIFGTGPAGNVYFIEYARGPSVVGWVLDWKSFYHERIVY